MRTHMIVAERFLLEERVSYRPYASVWKAIDLRKGVLVALRVAMVQDHTETDAMRRAQRELQLTAGLRDRGLVRVRGWGDEQAFFWIATEWVEGEDLRVWQQRVLPQGMCHADDGPRVAALLGMYAEIARAMAVAHAAGVLHRDLSPSNVRMSSTTGRPVVIDFGLARASSMTDGTRLTRTLGMVGSPYYLSPEAVAGVPCTAQSDVFSVTCMLWEALSGAPPWRFASVLDTALARLHGPPLWRRPGARWPQSLAGVLESGLCTAEADRPGGMKALCDLLLNVRADILGADPRRSGERLRRFMWRVGWAERTNGAERRA